MHLPRVLLRFMRAAGSSSTGGGSQARLKSVAELDPTLLAKARRLALGIGTAAGGFGSLVGVGGGVLIGPAILNACPAVPQRVISGTSLAAVFATGVTAGSVYFSSDCVDVRSAGLLAAAAVVTAPLGARVTHRVDCQRLRKALGYWLYLVAPLVPLKAMLTQPQQQPEQQQQQQAAERAAAAQPPAAAPGSSLAAAAAPAPAAALAAAAAAAAGAAQGSSSGPAVPAGPGAAQRQPHAAMAHSPGADAALAAVGCLAGFASGLLGIGGGTIVTPLLALITQAPQQTVLGTSLVAMIPPAAVGLLQHSRLGNVDWRMGAMLAAGTMAGSYAGSHLALSAPPGVLEGLFAAGMLLLGRRTLAAAAKAVPRAAT